MQPPFLATLYKNNNFFYNFWDQPELPYAISRYTTQKHLYRFRLTILYVWHGVTTECTSGVVNMQEGHVDKL
jgi:hypothetical protein